MVLNVKKSNFFRIRRKKVIVRMWSKRIIKSFNVFKNAKMELTQRSKGFAIEFFVLKEAKKGFNRGVLPRRALARKGLNDVVFIQEFAKGCSRILAALIRMKKQRVCRFSLLNGRFKCLATQRSICCAGEFPSDNFS